MPMGCLNGLTEVTVASMYGNKDCNRGRLGVIIPFLSLSLSVTSFYGVVNVFFVGSYVRYVMCRRWK
jgi:hypothetical protein